jgi:hypothetical protein
MCFFLSFPAKLIVGTAGSGKGEEPSGEKFLRLIQIRLTTPSLEKSHLLVKHNRRKRESPIRIPEKRSAFHRRAQRRLPVAAMCVSNPDSSPLGINGCNITQTLTAFLDLPDYAVWEIHPVVKLNVK